MPPVLRTMCEAFRAKMAKREYEEKSGTLTDKKRQNKEGKKAGKKGHPFFPVKKFMGVLFFNWRVRQRL